MDACRSLFPACNCERVSEREREAGRERKARERAFGKQIPFRPSNHSLARMHVLVSTLEGCFSHSHVVATRRRQRTHTRARVIHFTSSATAKVHLKQNPLDAPCVLRSSAETKGETTVTDTTLSPHDLSPAASAELSRHALPFILSPADAGASLSVTRLLSVCTLTRVHACPCVPRLSLLSRSLTTRARDTLIRLPLTLGLLCLSCRLPLTSSLARSINQCARGRSGKSKQSHE